MVDVRRTLLVSTLLFFAVFPVAAAQKPLLICYGDSITAGYGLAEAQAYPAALQLDLARLGYRYLVKNMGTSGATTKDAIEDLSSVIDLHPAIVIVEFGGNDGLRGLPLAQTRHNLDTILAALTAAHVHVLLAGITLPPNYGPDYIQQFDKTFRDLAATHRVAFIPMIYKDLIHEAGTIQPDGIHPTAKGSAILAKTLLTGLRPLLRK